MEFKDPSNIHSKDDIYLLIFLENRHVVQYAELNRHQSNFSLGEVDYITPTNDLILVER